MYNFASDYLEGAHPQVMEALNKTNFIQTVGYGEDQYCQKAKDKIKAILENENVCIFSYIAFRKLRANPAEARAPYFPPIVPANREMHATMTIHPPMT